jgi:hypothetical protein
VVIDDFYVDIIAVLNNVQGMMEQKQEQNKWISIYKHTGRLVEPATKNTRTDKAQHSPLITQP